MAIRPELAQDAGQLLAKHGYTVDRVFDVDAEGPEVIVCFEADGKARTALIALDRGKVSIAVADGWDVP